MRVAVIGAAGRMGSAVCEAVVVDEHLDLVAAVDPLCSGEKDPTDTVVVSESLNKLEPAVLDVAVDLNVSLSARLKIHLCLN